MKTSQIQRNIKEINEIYQLLSQVKSETSNNSTFKARKFHEDLRNSLKTKKNHINKLFLEHFRQGNWMLERVSWKNPSNEEHSPCDIPQETEENAENPLISSKKLENPYETRENQPIKPKTQRNAEVFPEEGENFSQPLEKTKPKFEFLRKTNKNSSNFAKNSRKPEKKPEETVEIAGFSSSSQENRGKIEEPQDLHENIEPNPTKFEFLKRKSQKIPANKLDLAGVRSRIDCWVSKASNNRGKSKGNPHNFPSNTEKNSVSRSRGAFILDF